VAGGDVNARDNKGRTALMSACSAERFDIVQMLLARGADPNLQNTDGDTALMVAAMGDSSLPGSAGRGNLEIVRMLLAKGADPNLKGGWPPLVVAAEHGDNDLIKFLLEKGADINVKNSRGMSALSRAIYDGRVETAKMLLANGANVDSRDDFGDTPLLLAAAGNSNLTRELLDRHADVNAQNKSLESALMRANRPETVALLLDHGADLNARDKRGHTALMHAVPGNFEKTRLLLEKGADVNARNQNGVTALTIARSYSGNFAIIGILLRFGAGE
jgi:ankyrin repeat protein